jgi:hypothetical protein
MILISVTHVWKTGQRSALGAERSLWLSSGHVEFGILPRPPWSFSEVATRKREVRFTPRSGHRQSEQRRPKSAMSGRQMAQIGRAHYPSTTPPCPSGVSRLETEHATFYPDPTLILAVMAVEKRPLGLPFRSH